MPSFLAGIHSQSTCVCVPCASLLHGQLKHTPETNERRCPATSSRSKGRIDRGPAYTGLPEALLCCTCQSPCLKQHPVWRSARACVQPIHRQRQQQTPQSKRRGKRRGCCQPVREKPTYTPHGSILHPQPSIVISEHRKTITRIHMCSGRVHTYL